MSSLHLAVGVQAEEGLAIILNLAGAIDALPDGGAVFRWRDISQVFVRDTRHFDKKCRPEVFPPGIRHRRTGVSNSNSIF